MQGGISLISYIEGKGQLEPFARGCFHYSFNLYLLSVCCVLSSALNLALVHKTHKFPVLIELGILGWGSLIEICGWGAVSRDWGLGGES